MPKKLTFTTPEKIRDLARRGEAWETSEARQMLPTNLGQIRDTIRTLRIAAIGLLSLYLPLYFPGVSKIDQHVDRRGEHTTRVAPLPRCLAVIRSLETPA